MGKRGPPRKPTALKVVQGTARADRVNAGEPVPSGPLGDPPPRLEGAALECWLWLADAANWLTVADRKDAERYCDRWALRMQALELVQDFGQLYVKADKRTSKDKWYTQINGPMQALDKHEDALNRIGGKLGLNPADRAEIDTGKKRDTDDPWSAFG